MRQQVRRTANRLENLVTTGINSIRTDEEEKKRIIELLERNKNGE